MARPWAWTDAGISFSGSVLWGTLGPRLSPGANRFRLAPLFAPPGQVHGWRVARSRADRSRLCASVGGQHHADQSLGQVPHPALAEPSDRAIDQLGAEAGTLRTLDRGSAAFAPDHCEPSP